MSESYDLFASLHTTVEEPKAVSNGYGNLVEARKKYKLMWSK